MMSAPIRMSFASNPPMGTPSELAMRQSSRLKRQLSGICRTDVAERIVSFLRRRYPHNTAENVAADTGIKSATVSKWMERTSAPSVSAFLQLWNAYDANLLAAVAPRTFGWLDEAVRAQAQAGLDARIAELRAQRELLG